MIGYERANQRNLGTERRVLSASTANDLENIKDSEIYQALIRWIESGKKTNVARGSFSCRQLMADLGMKYPAALIFLDWYCEDPKTAMESIRCSGG